MTDIFKNKILKIFIFVAILDGIVFGLAILKNKPKPQEKNEIVVNDKISNSPEETKTADEPEIENNPIEEAIPDKIFIKVPFVSQAPFGKWDLRHEEACEEASLLMVKYYLDEKTLNKEIAEKEIQKMIDFEIKKYGDFKDSNAREIVKLGEDFYGIKNLKVIYDFKKEDLKKYLAKGKPMIVPVAGRMLGNPNFTPPGPLYHNLVLVGYAGNIIITNDPGTRKGESYEYATDILYQAIHDFTGKKEDIQKGRKAMIVLE